MWMFRNFIFVWCGSLLFGLAVLWVCLKLYGDNRPQNPPERATLALAQLEDAIIAVESGGNLKAFNANENACGPMQIRPICVEDVNRILGHEVYSLSDRWDMGKSREIFRIYTGHYSDGSFESRARVWNGGPSGTSKRATRKYWQKVQRHLHR